MKKNKVNRLLSLLLSSAMIISLAACGNNSDKESQESQPKSKEESQQQSVAEESGEEELEPITVTVGMNVSAWNAGDGIFTEQEPVLQYIKDKFNLEFDIRTYDSEKFALLVSTNDFTDVFQIWGDYQIMVDAGVVMPLNDLLDEYGQDIVSKYSASLENCKELYGNGETYYYIGMETSLPTEMPSKNGDIGFQVRYDVWKAIGSPEYETIDEVVDVLKQMQDYQREQTGDNSVYGISLSCADGKTIFRMGLPSLGYTYDCLDPIGDYKTGDYAPDACKEDSPLWTVAEFVNKCQRAGVLDPDSFTQDAGTANTKVSSGKALSTMLAHVNMDEALEDEAVMVTLPYTPFNNARNLFGNISPFGSSHCTFINSECDQEKAERFMMVLNWLFTDEGVRTVYNGVPGVHWDYNEEGVPVFVGELAAAYEESIEAGNEMKNAVSLCDTGFGTYFTCGSNMACTDGYPVNLNNSADFIVCTPAELAFAQEYDCNYPGEVYAKWIEEGKFFSNNTDNATKIEMIRGKIGSCSDEALANRQAAYGDFTNNVINLFLAESDDDFNSIKADMIEALHELGMAGYNDEYYAMVEGAKAAVAAILGQ